MSVIVPALIMLLTMVGMELFAWFAHKYIMHGWGSHHEPPGSPERRGWFEKNDLYAVVFASIAIILIALGTAGRYPLQWIGAA